MEILRNVIRVVCAMANNTTSKYQKVLKQLLALPKLKQKSKEWYEMRHNMITASDFAQALGEGKFGTQKQLIEKKCMPLSTEDNKAFSKSNPFFAWGNMFEPVACAVYSSMKGVFVHEFGLLQHPRYSFFGASPDGISDEGIMLEIKCPFKRKITGDIPTQYYYQIQGQLDVCGLDECDYFECEFLKYDDYESYNKGYYEGGHRGYTGFLWESSEGDFEYSKVYNNCIGKQMDGCMYWILKEYNLKRVYKDPEFVEMNMKRLEDVWKQILYYRDNPDKFELEVKKTITLETQSLNPVLNIDIQSGDNDGKIVSEYMMVDLEDECIDVKSSKSQSKIGKMKTTKKSKTCKQSECMIIDLE